ncbi:unnamed protein product [Symbiodinium sp. KB8]|nr:unnamed protein product [Symbiodinium sp. KB8]
MNDDWAQWSHQEWSHQAIGPAGAGALFSGSNGPSGPSGSTGPSPFSAPVLQMMSLASWPPSMVSNMMLGHPVPLNPQGEQAEHEEKRYDGTVKCFYGEKHTGHGFIFCPEIYNRTGQDVYLHARQAHRCEVGDEVSFTVVFNSRREPQARSVVKKEEEGKFLSKKREEAERQANALQMKRQRPSMGSAASGASGASAGASSDSVMTEEQARKFQKSLQKGR